MLGVIATLPVGEMPIVTFVDQGGNPPIIPLAGMPVGGWDMRLGYWQSYLPATGAVVANIPAGVLIDNLQGIKDGLVLKINPPPGTGVLGFSLIPAGQGRVFSIDAGSAVDHTTNTGALVRTLGLGGDTYVIAIRLAGQALSVGPLTGPLLELVGNDGGVGSQQDTLGGLPNGWLAGGGPGSPMIVISDSTGNDPTSPTFAPGFTGGGGTFFFNSANANMVSYAPAVPGNWPFPPPTDVAEALDVLIAGASSPTSISGNWLQVGLALRDAVRSTAVADTLALADNGAFATASPFVGLIVAIPAPGTAVVSYSGEFPWGALGGPPLTPGAPYWLGTAGGITTVAPDNPPDPLGTVVLRVGYAKSTTILVLTPGEPVEL
jgi:hypothetical protein